MKISTKSWHYRLCRKVFSNPSNSLCIYFWQIPTAAVVYAVATVFTFSLVGLVVAMYIAFLSMPILLNFMGIDWVGTLLLGCVSMVIWLATLKEVYDHYYRCSWDKVLWESTQKEKRLKEDYTKKPPNLVFEYLKAKKDKICPTIEFDWS